MKKIQNSLMAKIILLCSSLVLFASLTMSLYAYRTASSSITEATGQTALNITRSVVGSIDVSRFEKLQTAADMQQDYYKELGMQLNNIRKSTGLKYLYTMRKTSDGKYIYVVDGEENASLLGDVETEITKIMKMAFEGKEGYEMTTDNNWGNIISAYIPIKNTSGETVGILAADFDANLIAKQLKTANTEMFTSAGIIIIISILLAVAFAILIIRSLKQLQAKIQLVSQGDLTINVESGRTDEVGKVSQALQATLTHMSSMIRNIRNNTYEIITSVDSLNEQIDDSNKATENITQVITEIASGAVNQVDSTKSVSESMEKVFEGISLITGHINVVNIDSDTSMQNMKEASKILKGSVEQINLVNDTVDATSDMIKELQDKFLEVLSFSDSISAIAKQTNLLALNASIEAATAGEHGKGFAVVAGEIKNLATQSNLASNKIHELIYAVQGEINKSSDAIENGVVQARDGVNVISQVEVYLDKLSESNQKVDSSIKEITEAIKHIEHNSQEVLEKTEGLEEISREFSAGTQQTAAETEEQLAIMEVIRSGLLQVRDMMEQLGQSVNQFKID